MGRLLISGVRKSSSIGSRKGHQQWEQQRGRPRGPRSSSRSPKRERQSDHQEAWGSRKRSPSKKPKGKQNVWKDVPEHDRNVHKVGVVGHWLPDDALPLPDWLARADSWPTKAQLDDEASYYLDLVPVKDVEWIIPCSMASSTIRCCPGVKPPWSVHCARILWMASWMSSQNSAVMSTACPLRTCRNLLGMVRRSSPHAVCRCLTLDELMGKVLQLLEVIKQLLLDALNMFCDRLHCLWEAHLLVLPRLFRLV